MGPPAISDAFTVAVIGDGGVGKSALTKRFALGYFVEDHIPTIEDVYTRSISVANRTYDLHIWDTSAPDRQPSGRVLLTERLRAHALRADGIILCYSVTDADSFRAALAMYKQIQALRADKTPVVIAATKADPSLADIRQVRPLTYGHVLAQLGVQEDMYAETCARQNRDCSKVFFTLARAILAAKAEAKEIARMLKRNPSRKRAESSPALPLESLSLTQTPVRSNSFGEIEFDASSAINTGARPLTSAHQLPQQPTLGHQRSRSLSRTTTSMRKQKEGVRTIPAVPSRGALTGISSDLTVGGDRDDRTTLRSFGSCSNLAGMNGTVQRAATLRRQASQTLGPAVSRSMSVRSLAELDSGSSDAREALMVHEEVARALQGIVSAEELPVPANLSKRQLRHLRHKSSSHGSLIESVHTSSPASSSRFFQRASSLADDSDSALGSLSSNETNSPEPDDNHSIRTHTSNSSGETSASNNSSGTVSKASSFKLGLGRWKLGTWSFRKESKNIAASASAAEIKGLAGAVSPI